MTTCRSCGAEIPDVAAFCQVCGASAHEEAASPKGNQIVMPKTVFYLAMIALALMGIVAIGLAARGPTMITNTSYVTQMQISTVSIGYTSGATMTIISTMTAGSSTTAVGPPPIWFNQQYCGFPFDPLLCNEGPPVTVIGQITNDTTCVNLYVGTGQTYVVWNLPETVSDGSYQVYGYVYPNWPPTQPFPPYPFLRTICIGTPMWAVPPYIEKY